MQPYQMTKCLNMGKVLFCYVRTACQHSLHFQPQPHDNLQGISLAFTPSNYIPADSTNSGNSKVLVLANHITKSLLLSVLVLPLLI